MDLGPSGVGILPPAPEGPPARPADTLPGSVTVEAPRTLDKTLIGSGLWESLVDALRPSGPAPGIDPGSVHHALEATTGDAAGAASPGEPVAPSRGMRWGVVLAIAAVLFLAAWRFLGWPVWGAVLAAGVVLLGAWLLSRRGA